MIEVDAFLYAQVESLLPLENGCQMKGIMALDVTDVETAAELFEQVGCILLILKYGVLGGGTLEGVVIVDKHGGFMLIFFEEFANGFNIVLT
jgi:hypothetical protein